LTNLNNFVCFLKLRTSGIIMQRPFFKLNRKSKFVTISPLGLALTACGGGSSEERPDVVSKVDTHSDFVTFALTGNDFIDASTQGSKWVPTDGVITFAVADGFNGERWANPDEALEALSDGMQQIVEFSNLEAKNLGYFANPELAGEMGATIVVSLDGQNKFFTETTSWATGKFPQNQMYERAGGDIYFNLNSQINEFTNDAAYQPGGIAYAVLLHELGHAFGLKHPFDNAGGRPTYEDVGLESYNDMRYTVMAYDDDFGGMLNAPATFMLGDALALMSLYGVNTSTNTGDDTYSFDDLSFRTAIWDADGTDTIDLSACNNDARVELTTYYSTADLGFEYGFIVIDANSDEEKFTGIMGEFENVTCGSGDDLVYGDENNNVIIGGTGNDEIYGRDGDDVIFGGTGDDFIVGGVGDDNLAGGAGADTFVIGLGHGSDTIVDFQDNIDQVRFYLDDQGNNPYTGRSASDEGFLVYNLVDGSSITLDGILYIT
jgi:Ca2+-binding RTX toxin-like protein